ncbi:MAG TPA: antibiotic biosynthesis monooxygenase [Phycisphaerae bacterium]
MITVGMNYQVRDGKQSVFENAFNKVLHAMQGMPGHMQSFLYRDVNDPLSYLIVSEWNDRQAFDAFIASDAFRNVANWGKEQILTARPKHEIYEK